jgi:hypothetical protein
MKHEHTGVVLTRERVDGIELAQELADGRYGLRIEFVYSVGVDRDTDTTRFGMDAKGSFEEMVSVF